MACKGCGRILADPGVNHQDVQPAKRLDRDLHHLEDSVTLRHDGGYRQPPTPSGYNLSEVSRISASVRAAQHTAAPVWA